MAITLTKTQAHTTRLNQESAVFDALFQQYWPRLCELLFRLTGDWHESEDLALETFLRLYQQPPDHDQNLPGWLYRVATNLGLNAVRAQTPPGLRRRSRPARPGWTRFQRACTGSGAGVGAISGTSACACGSGSDKAALSNALAFTLFRALLCRDRCCSTNSSQFDRDTADAGRARVCKEVQVVIRRRKDASERR